MERQISNLGTINWYGTLIFLLWSTSVSGNSCSKWLKFCPMSQSVLHPMFRVFKMFHISHHGISRSSPWTDRFEKHRKGCPEYMIQRMYILYGLVCLAVLIIVSHSIGV